MRYSNQEMQICFDLLNNEINNDNSDSSVIQLNFMSSFIKITFRNPSKYKLYIFLEIERLKIE